MNRPPDTILHEWSWDDCAEHVLALKRLVGIAVAGREFALYGVPRGGLVFALMLAHQLGREGELAAQSMGQGVIVPKGTKVAVVVDDVCETGATFKKVRERFEGKCAVVCVSVVTKARAEFDPDVSASITPDNIWVQFPWELETADVAERDGSAHE